MKAFHHAYSNYLEECDWFLKADDDTYVIVENLRFMLSSFSKDDPIFFGHHFKTNVKQGKVSDQANPLCVSGITSRD